MERAVLAREGAVNKTKLLLSGARRSPGAATGPAVPSQSAAAGPPVRSLRGNLGTPGRGAPPPAFGLPARKGVWWGVRRWSLAAVGGGRGAGGGTCRLEMAAQSGSDRTTRDVEFLLKHAESKKISTRI